VYAPPPAAPEKPRTVTIEVFQGARRVESTFKDPDAASAGEVRP
jgi:hypothetical protein